MDISKVDLTNTNQKILAGVFIVCFIALFAWALPSITWFLANTAYAIGLFVLISFAVLNRNNIWNYMKQISWDITKAMIAKNRPDYLYKYYDYIVQNNAELKDSVLKVKGTETKTVRRIEEIKNQLENDKKQAVLLQGKNAPKSVMSVLETKIDINTQKYNTLMPRLENTKKQSKYLEELLDLRTAEATNIKMKIDAKVEEYEMLKDMNSATESASKFLKEGSIEFKMYQEGLKQIEDTSSQYIANIQLFETQTRPLIESMQLEKEVSADAGAKLIEEWKQSNEGLKIAE